MAIGFYRQTFSVLQEVAWGVNGSHNLQGESGLSRQGPFRYFVVMRSEQNLVLTGFMGTGKTTVGRMLAEKLGMEFVDTDELIESRHGPIPRIFADRGESEFRAIEQEVARELGERSGLVIATGGRMVLDDDNFGS